MTTTQKAILFAGVAFLGLRAIFPPLTRGNPLYAGTDESALLLHLLIIGAITGIGFFLFRKKAGATSESGSEF